MPEALQREIHDLRSLLGSDRDPDGRAFAPLADALRRAGDLEPALQLVSDGVGRLPEFTSGYVVAGWIHGARGAGEEAESCFRRALDLDPHNVHALRGLGLLVAERGLEAEALTLFARVEELEPGDPEIRARLSDLADTVVDVRELFPDIVPVELLGPDAAPPTDEERLDTTDDPPATDTVGDAMPVEGLAPEGTGDVIALHGQPLAADRIDVGPVEPAGEAATSSAPLPTPARKGGSEGPKTRTMAELYASQGFPRRAIEVYEHLLREAPGDEDLERRLEELRNLGSGRGPGTSSGGADDMRGEYDEVGS